MTSRTWDAMRSARVGVGVESVLLKIFDHPSRTLERRIIQSKEFRSTVIPVLTNHCLKKAKALSESTLPEFLACKMPKTISVESQWLLEKLRQNPISSESSANEAPSFYPQELRLTGPKYPFEPKELTYLQRKTDTLTGRELTKLIDVPVSSSTNGRGRMSHLRRVRGQLREYRWKVQDDDDNLAEDVLAPKYSSF